MERKISIAISRDVLSRLDRLARQKESRSALVERLLREYLRDRRRDALNARVCGSSIALLPARTKKLGPRSNINIYDLTRTSCRFAPLHIRVSLLLNYE